MSIKNSQNQTALAIAIFQGRLAMMVLLIEHGADINEVSKDGNTALHVAINYGRYDFAEWFIKHGANGNIKDKSGKIAIDLLKKFFKFELVMLLKPEPTQATSTIFKPVTASAKEEEESPAPIKMNDKPL